MDWPTFSSYSCVFCRLSLKTDHSLFFLGEKPYYFLPDVVRAILGYNQNVHKLLEQFWAIATDNESCGDTVYQNIGLGQFMVT